jgi:hypothetical protein
MSDPKFESEFVLLVRADSIIQKEALLAALREENIDVRAPEMTLNRSVTDTTLDLALGGYSAVHERGFPIFVREVHQDRAKKIIDQVIKEYHNQEPARLPMSLNKFYVCSLYSIALPGLMHLLGLYHLVRYFKTKEQDRENINWVLMTGSLIIFTASLVMAVTLFKHSALQLKTWF